MKQGFLMNYSFIFLPAALGVLLPALFLPWIVINFLGLTPFSQIDILESALWRDSGRSSDQQGRPDVQDFISSYQDTSVAIGASMVSFMVSIVGMSIAIPFRRHRSAIALSAGILAIASSLLWFYSIESLKSNFAQQAAMTGGLIGEEFKGHERSLADIIIGLGLGPYVALAGGALGIVAFFSYKVSLKKT